MGLFRNAGKLLDIAKDVTSIIDEAVVDKDKVVEVKAKLAEFNHELDLAAQEAYKAELQAPMDFRTIQRPLWSFICAISFAIQIVSFVTSYMVKLFNPAISMEPLIFPLPINAILIAVVTFYFGGRMIDKKNGNKFSEKWGL